MITKEKTTFDVYPYRWVVLLSFIFMTIMTQVIWITFAPITNSTALQLFGNTTDSSLNLVLLLSLVFMILYVPMNYPACKAIDKFGLKWGTGIGVIITGIFGFLRAVKPTSYTWILIFQIGCAIGQPFVLNSFTKLATNWFPEKEKTLASGLGTMSLLLGVMIAMLVSPMLFGLGMATMLYVYGGITLFFTVLYLILVKDKPPTPANAYGDKTKVFETKGTLDLFKKRDFNILFILILIGLGVFNAISTGIDLLFYDLRNVPPALTHDDAVGLIGGIMIVGGIIGAIVLSTLSDKFRKRRIFLILAVLSSTIISLLYFFIHDFIVVLILSFIFGFFLISALPIGLTFAAEITYPIPEETSNGWLIWIGQISGIILITLVMFLMTTENGLVLWNFIVYVILFAVGTALVFFINDLDKYELKT
ncbi:MAG: MFS transporter [Candidatus Heimdallarchaeaceae archaeon]